jgi:signal transduction histidine kinase
MRINDKSLSELSLRGKLALSSLLPSVLVLFLAAAAFVTYDSISFRASVLRNLRGHAHFIALTTRAALQFQSLDYAQRIMAGLTSNPEVTAGAIYDSTGYVVVEYFPENHPPRPLPNLDGVDYPRAPRGKIWLFQPILLDDQPIGTVFIEASYAGFWKRFWILAAGALAALLLLLLLAYALSSRLQRHISTPLLVLGETARVVSEKKDYSVRVEDQPGPEFRLLTEAFNQMLRQIESQDTELRARAADLEAANRELESFTYTVAHDLRSPLRGLSGFSHLVMTKHAAALPAEAQDYLGRIRGNAERMADLIDDLLAFSHLDTQPLKADAVDPAAIARNAFEEVQEQFRGRQINLRVDPLPLAKADPALLRQVFVNLLSNAAKYTRPRSVAEIHVGTRGENGKAVYFVSDNGVGFDMRHAQKLFRVFQRLHSSEDFEGTGVGLAIVQRIIARHGGKIWPEAAPDQGATFYFTLN